MAITIKIECPACDGTKVVRVDNADGNSTEAEPCMYCSGSGESPDEKEK